MTHHERYEQLKSQLADIGWIRRGSLTERYMPCGTKTCRCNANPPQLHGPYYQYKRVINGKTHSIRVTRQQADLIQGWINNGRHLNDIIKTMEQIAHEHTDHLLQHAAHTPAQT